jgi:16S rRNA (cytosine967-C5)-methyltransferase
VLRNVANNLETVSFKVKGGTFADQFALQFSHPKWLLERWIEYFGFSEAQELMAANNQIPKITFRLNRLKNPMETVIAGMDERKVVYQKGVIDGFVIPEKFYDLEPLLNDGAVSVQTESQALACLLLDPKPGESILDMCAAPGGKSTFMAELMQNTGHIMSMDLYENKLEDINRLAAALGITTITTLKADAHNYKTETKYDRVLCDVPCTGTGVLARRAELRWRLTAADITSMSNLQRAILGNASRAVKPDGVVVYATCSLEPEENERQVENFLKVYPEWRIQNAKEILPESLHGFVNESGMVRVLPHKHQMDGAFSVRLVKNG